MRILPLLSQNDPRWANIGLGGTTNRIGDVGCYLTSFCVVATYYGHVILPPDLNQKFIDAGLFANGDLISSDDDLQKIFPDIVYKQSYNFPNTPPTPADLNLLKDLLSDPTVSVIVEIDLGGGLVHFTPAVDCDGINVTIMNVWNGLTQDLKIVYGDPSKVILKYVVYQGTLPSSSSPTSPTTVIEVNQSDWVKVLGKSGNLDQVGNYLGFTQADIDNIDFGNVAIAKIKELSTPLPVIPTSTNSQVAPEIAPSSNIPEGQSNPSSKRSLLQWFLDLLTERVSQNNN